MCQEGPPPVVSDLGSAPALAFIMSDGRRPQRGPFPQKTPLSSLSFFGLRLKRGRGTPPPPAPLHQRPANPPPNGPPLCACQKSPPQRPPPTPAPGNTLPPLQPPRALLVPSNDLSDLLPHRRPPEKACTEYLRAPKTTDHHRRKRRCPGPSPLEGGRAPGPVLNADAEVDVKAVQQKKCRKPLGLTLRVPLAHK